MTTTRTPARARRGSTALRLLFVVLALGLVAVLVLRALDRGDAAADPGAGPLVRDLAHDDRIDYLLAPCTRGGPFLEDTSDMIPVLVARLEHGELDPLRRAKAELSALGETALPELRRLFDARFAEPHTAPVLQNVLVVVGLMETDAGHDVLVRGLAHHDNGVRSAAIRGLVRHARPADYDALLAQVAISGPDTHPDLAAALLKCDRARFEGDFERLAHLEEYGRVIFATTPLITDSPLASTIEAFRRLWPLTSGDLRVYFAAAVAHAGDAEARAEIDAALASPNPQMRALAVHALNRVDPRAALPEAAAVLRDDPKLGPRRTAAEVIAHAPASPETEALLVAGLGDPERGVRAICLEALVGRAHPTAEDVLLEMLKGERTDVEDALRILRPAWNARPELAERGFEILAARVAEVGYDPRSSEFRTLVRAIAQVPIVRAAEWIYERALTTEGRIDGLPAHRWFLTQAGNTGPRGWAFLRERWKLEADPARRVDIVTACSYDHGDTARDFLAEVLESERTTPLELLHAADLLANKGPAARAAPLLKRVALRTSDPLVRPALDCLLWRWYGVGLG